MDIDPGDRKLLVRVVAAILAAFYGTQLLLVLGKGAACAYRIGCSLDEQKLLYEYLTNSLATIVAILFAVTK